MDPVRELPYWPAAMALLIEAGQMTASDYVPIHPNLSLASKGASTDAVRSARCSNGGKTWAGTYQSFATFTGNDRLRGKLAIRDAA